MKLTDTKFRDLDLPEELLRALDESGYLQLSEVQDRTLPLVLAGRDVAVQAQTGSGKTAVFLITAFCRMLANPRPETKGACPRTIVITPTRELAVQVARDAETLGRYLPFTTLAVYGGVDYAKQRDTLRQGVDILVGTPGRLIDYLKQKVYHLKDVEIAVIDEADRLFDMGFIADARFMLRRMSRWDRRQSMLFSATIGWRVVELAYEHMNAPELIEINPEQITAERIEQVLYHVGSHEKFNLFFGLLSSEEWTKALVFVNTKREAAHIRDRLRANGHEAVLLSGDVDQTRRLKILRSFTAGEVRILIATDVASRGLHIDGISHVFNYDLPQDPEDYVHRIGRTARAGASGKAVTLADERYVLALDAIQKYIGREIPVAWADDRLFVDAVRVARPRRTPDASRSGRRGGRPGDGPRRSRPRETHATSDPAPAREPVPEGGQPASEGAAKSRRRRPRRKAAKPSGEA